MNKGTIDVKAAIKAQKEYCEKKKKPHFAPKNGVCLSCGRQIYDRITKERASKDVISSCPYCHRSWCD